MPLQECSMAGLAADRAAAAGGADTRAATIIRWHTADGSRLSTVVALWTAPGLAPPAPELPPPCAGLRAEREPALSPS